MVVEWQFNYLARSEGDLGPLLLCCPVFNAFGNIQGENKHMHVEQKSKLKHLHLIHVFEKGAHIILDF